MSGELNEVWLKNLAKQIDAVPDCKALGKLILYLKDIFIELIKSVISEIFQLLGFLLPPTNLAKIIKWIKNLILKWLAPYLVAIEKMIKLILAFIKVIQAIIRKRNALHCSLTKMVKSEIGPAFLKKALKKAAFQAINPDLRTLSELNILMSGRVPSLSIIAGKLNVSIDQLPKIASAYGSATKFMTSMEDKFQYVEIPEPVPVPTIETPQEVFLDSGPPTITGISDPLGDETGGEEITITGTNFQEGATATLGDQDCTSVRVINPTQIKCYTPSGNRGMPVNLQVTNPDGQTATLANAYAYTEAVVAAAPTFTSITNISQTERPTSTTGSRAGGQDVRIVGTGFQSGATVQLGTLHTNTTVSEDGTTIDFVTDYQPKYGIVDLVITNPDKQSVTVPEAWIYE